jgi:hypothetical protein
MCTSCYHQNLDFGKCADFCSVYPNYYMPSESDPNKITDSAVG